MLSVVLRRGGTHNVPKRMPSAWVQLECWEEVDSTIEPLPSDPAPHLISCAVLQSITTYPTSHTAQFVQQLATIPTKEDSSTVLMGKILARCDFWSCQMARSVCRGWHSIVDGICVGQVALCPSFHLCIGLFVA